MPVPPLLALFALVACVPRSTEAVSAAPVVDTALAFDLLAEGDLRWPDRGDPAALAAAKEAWSAALAIDSASRAALGRLAHTAWIEGWTADEESAATLWFTEAEALAARCLDADPHAVGARARGLDLKEQLALVEPDTLVCVYWGARALEDRSWGRSVSLGMRAAPEVESAMAEVGRRLPAIDAHGPTRWEGAHFARLPSFAGRDILRSEAAFSRAVQLSPGVLEVMLLRAAHLAPARGDGAAFDRDLAAIATAEPGSAPDAAPENRRVQALAVQLAADRATLFPPPRTR